MVTALSQKGIDVSPRADLCTYTTLLTTCKLSEHIADIDAEASQRVRELTVAFANTDGITEQLMAENNLLWAQEMNSCRARAEEIVLREVVYR